MSNRIWKFPLGLGDTVIKMPATAKVLSAQNQFGSIALWAICSPEKSETIRKFLVTGTGHELPEGRLEFIDTVQTGDFVWHVFEVLP